MAEPEDYALVRSEHEIPWVGAAVAAPGVGGDRGHPERIIRISAALGVLAARTGMAVVPGTVSQYVLLKSHCPVTIGPHDGKDEERDDNQS